MWCLRTGKEQASSSSHCLLLPVSSYLSKPKRLGFGNSPFHPDDRADAFVKAVVVAVWCVEVVGIFEGGSVFAGSDQLNVDGRRLDVHAVLWAKPRSDTPCPCHGSLPCKW